MIITLTLPVAIIAAIVLFVMGYLFGLALRAWQDRRGGIDKRSSHRDSETFSEVP